MEKIITIALAGYGARGQCYTNHALEHPERMKVVAVGEIDPAKLAKAKEKLSLPQELCFNSAEEMLELPRLADVLFICTQDRQHVPMALKALEQGYHIVTEKPISPDIGDCLALQKQAHKYNRVVTVCHVLRYSAFYQRVKEILDSGILGEICNISAIEDVGYFHQAHSFVRGNWRSSEETSPMILAKSCHDMDILQWLMGQRCKYISSFGSLGHFRAEKAPEGAALRCLSGCRAKETCPYDAEKIYIQNELTGIRGGCSPWPCNAVVLNPTEENLYEALRTGPYGRCVYHCDNNVVDHEVVTMEFENGATADFTMTAFTPMPGRQIRVMGTLGLLSGNAQTMELELSIFGRETEHVAVPQEIVCKLGHSDGDSRLVDSVVNNLLKGNLTDSLTSIDDSVHSHIMALAAEESRLHHGVPVEIAGMQA